jgi:hypothetical protein
MEESTMQAAPVTYPGRALAADPYSCTDREAAGQPLAPAAVLGSAPADTRGGRLRRIVSFLPRVATTRARYYDPMFALPDLIEDEYYRLRNQPCG